MSELDLLNLARSCGQSVNGDFAQVTTITFAIVVAIYYFLRQAGRDEGTRNAPRLLSARSVD